MVWQGFAGEGWARLASCERLASWASWAGLAGLAVWLAGERRRHDDDVHDDERTNEAANLRVSKPRPPSQSERVRER